MVSYLPLFLYFVFSTVNIIMFFINNFPLTGFELETFGFGSRGDFFGGEVIEEFMEEV